MWKVLEIVTKENRPECLVLHLHFLFVGFVFVFCHFLSNSAKAEFRDHIRHAHVRAHTRTHKFSMLMYKLMGSLWEKWSLCQVFADVP